MILGPCRVVRGGPAPAVLNHAGVRIAGAHNELAAGAAARLSPASRCGRHRRPRPAARSGRAHAHLAHLARGLGLDARPIGVLRPRSRPTACCGPRWRRSASLRHGIHHLRRASLAGVSRPVARRAGNAAERLAHGSPVLRGGRARSGERARRRAARRRQPGARPQAPALGQAAGDDRTARAHVARARGVARRSLGQRERSAAPRGAGERAGRRRARLRPPRGRLWLPLVACRASSARAGERGARARRRNGVGSCRRVGPRRRSRSGVGLRRRCARAAAASRARLAGSVAAERALLQPGLGERSTLGGTPLRRRARHHRGGRAGCWRTITPPRRSTRRRSLRTPPPGWRALRSGALWWRARC